MTGHDPFEEALDRVAADQSPRFLASDLAQDEQQMLKMAQLIRGARGSVPEREFTHDLQSRLNSRSPRLSRRTAVLSSLGAMAAGLLAGVGLDRAARSSPTETSAYVPLVGKRGSWVPVARLADLPSGAVRSFTAGAVQGFVINHAGSVRAVSRICTHMGCALQFQGQEQHFVCPCHGAEFDVHGRFLYGANGRPYSPALPPLPHIEARVRNDAVEVWTV